MSALPDNALAVAAGDADPQETQEWQDALQGVIDQDASFIRVNKAGDGVESQSLAGAAGAEQHSRSGRRLELDVEREGGRILAAWKALPDARVNHPPARPKSMRPTRLATLRTASASAEMTSTRIRAVAPCPLSTAS